MCILFVFFFFSFFLSLLLSPPFTIYIQIHFIFISDFPSSFFFFLFCHLHFHISGCIRLYYPFTFPVVFCCFFECYIMRSLFSRSLSIIRLLFRDVKLWNINENPNCYERIWNFIFCSNIRLYIIRIWEYRVCNTSRLVLENSFRMILFLIWLTNNLNGASFLNNDSADCKKKRRNS